MSKADYRSRIYKEYASSIQDYSSKFDITAAIKWGKAYHYYLKDWLPANENASIVDLGCGGGRLIHFLKQKGFCNIKGVDISSSQVKLAKQVLNAVIEADVLDFLESHQNSFDLIIGLDIIEHIKKDDMFRFLDCCFSSLNKGGRIIIQTPNAESPWGSVHRYNDFTHEVIFNTNSLRRLMSISGFDSIESRELGPVPWGYSLRSSIRFLLWQGIRIGLKFYNLVETGSPGSGVFTRIFMISGIKK